VPNEFRYRRRVQFAETDQEGVVHFSCFFRYMEEAEHALWRAAGLSIAPQSADLGWPRVAASFDFRNPLFFEDEFEVRVVIAQVTRRTIQYAFRIVRDDTTIGTGTLTAACVRKASGQPMAAVEIPDGLIDRLRSAAGDPA
jgi:acyl-CoA thioester hydrolase